MTKEDFKVYGYRWVVLLVFMFAVAINQLLWITYAAVTSDATRFYQVSDLSIALLSMSFMIVYIIVSIPASWVIDTYGIRTAVSVGAVLTGIFALMRGMAGSNYSLALIAQIGIAIGQPFILNATTTVAARWFPIRERATASGLGSLAVYLGILVGLLVTPFLTIRFGLGGTLMIYGILSLLPAITFLAFGKEKPLTPPCPAGMEARSLVFDGLKDMLHNRNFLILMVVFFMGLGAFNAVTTWIENILSPRGFNSIQAGIAGGIMILGGVVGALVIPTLSDKYHRRTPFIVIAVVGAILGMVGITYASGYALLLVSSFVLGFFLLAAGPVGFQYAAEITYPAPEGTSNGMLILMGQISGILFIVAMDSLKDPNTGSMTGSLLVLIGLLVVCLFLTTRLKESKAMLDEQAGGKK